MILSEYKKNDQTGLSMDQNKNVIVCEGCHVDQNERFQFLSQNVQEAAVKQLLKQETLLYGSIDFPFFHVNNVLASSEEVHFLYILFKSPMNPTFLIYDEYIYKNFPNTIQLLREIKSGGNLFILKKPNGKVLFVKICNIYEGEETLQMELA